MEEIRDMVHQSKVSTADEHIIMDYVHFITLIFYPSSIRSNLELCQEGCFTPYI